MLAMRFLEGEGTFTCVPQSPLVLQILLPQPVNLHSKRQKVGDAVSHHQNSQNSSKWEQQRHQGTL